MPSPHVLALLREREHYQRRNLPDRVAAVTAELVSLGYETARVADVPETTALESAPETTTPPRPKPRRSKTT